MPEKIKIAILDDYQRVSGKFADWSVLNDQADITAGSHFAYPVSARMDRTI
jgi:hypothetical protein